MYFCNYDCVSIGLRSLGCLPRYSVVRTDRQWWLNQRFYKYVKITQRSIFACSPLGGLSVKTVNNGVGTLCHSRSIVYFLFVCLFGWLVGFLTSPSTTRLYRGRSIVYNGVDSGPAASECTPWEWLAKNCTGKIYG